MIEVQSIAEFDARSLEEKLRMVRELLDPAPEGVRARGIYAKGKIRSLSQLRGKTAVLPSHWHSSCIWEPERSRTLLERVQWFRQNHRVIRASPLDFGIKLHVSNGVGILAGDYWIGDGFQLAILVMARSAEQEPYAELVELVQNHTKLRGVALEQVHSGVAKVRLAFPCTFDDIRELAEALEASGKDLPDDIHWFSTGRNLGLLEGEDPSEVAQRYSEAPVERCSGIYEYAYGVVFDQAVELGSSLECPSGWWTYEVGFMDSDAIALCGVDRAETILFDQPEARTIGVLSTSFGDIQLNQIYADGKYRLELESRYPLDELPKELADWGVEFDLG